MELSEAPVSALGHDAPHDLLRNARLTADVEARSLPGGQSCPRPLSEEKPLERCERHQRTAPVPRADVICHRHQRPVLEGDNVHQLHEIAEHVDATLALGYNDRPCSPSAQRVERAAYARARQIAIGEGGFVPPGIVDHAPAAIDRSGQDGLSGEGTGMRLSLAHTSTIQKYMNYCTLRSRGQD